MFVKVRGLNYCIVSNTVIVVTVTVKGLLEILSKPVNTAATVSLLINSRRHRFQDWGERRLSCVPVGLQIGDRVSAPRVERASTRCTIHSLLYKVSKFKGQPKLSPYPHSPPAYSY